MDTLEKTVMVLLSGGVDSAVSCARLIQDGYACQAVYMITCDEGLDAVDHVQQVADRLGAPLHILDLREEFHTQVIGYFLEEYSAGRTPNPCVFCNRFIKFGRLWEFARSQDCRFLATGHYAGIDRSGAPAALRESADHTKDQSYVLAMIRREVLDHVLLPMAGLTKRRTRTLAGELGLGLEHRDESQDICFIPDDDYAALLESRCPELAGDGPIVDRHGKRLGTHQGIHRYTIGQRRGLGVAMGTPYYVVRIDAATHTVVLGPKADVMRRAVRTGPPNWLINPPAAPLHAKVKIRYNDRGAPALVVPTDGGLRIEFEKPALAVTPGQTAVFYSLDKSQAQVLGGAWIERGD